MKGNRCLARSIGYFDIFLYFSVVVPSWCTLWRGCSHGGGAFLGAAVWEAPSGRQRAPCCSDQVRVLLARGAAASIKPAGWGHSWGGCLIFSQYFASLMCKIWPRSANRKQKTETVVGIIFFGWCWWRFLPKLIGMAGSCCLRDHTCALQALFWKPAFSCSLWVRGMGPRFPLSSHQLLRSDLVFAGRVTAWLQRVAAGQALQFRCFLPRSARWFLFILTNSSRNWRNNNAQIHLSAISFLPLLWPEQRWERRGMIAAKCYVSLP